MSCRLTSGSNPGAWSGGAALLPVACTRTSSACAARSCFRAASRSPLVPPAMRCSPCAGSIKIHFVTFKDGVGRVDVYCCSHFATNTAKPIRCFPWIS